MVHMYNVYLKEHSRYEDRTSLIAVSYSTKAERSDWDLPL